MQIFCNVILSQKTARKAGKIKLQNQKGGQINVCTQYHEREF